MNLKFLIPFVIFLSNNLCAQIKVGAENYEEYKSLLKDKKIGLVVNHTSFVNDKHLLDFLIEKGNTISKIFAPEHGFRGTGDAGEHISNTVDTKTGIPILSIYGKNKKPSKEQVNGIDLMIFDIQDVGVRFYTYISTMHYVMETCAENDIPLLILDRPNPNGHYIDGPILNIEFQSFIGMHPIPIVHGLTVGELAKMINNEGWLKEKKKCNLSVIKCENYTHSIFYKLPIAPSPNLPNMKSIYLYPSLCLFEGTDISIGRGTDKQFQIYGHPESKKGDFTFTPIPNAGAKYPKHQNKKCRGFNLSIKTEEELQQEKFNLNYLVAAYQTHPKKGTFFNENSFFEKLTGTETVRKEIYSRKSAEEIKKSWKLELVEYKNMRKKYLLYPDFE